MATGKSHFCIPTGFFSESAKKYFYGNEKSAIFVTYTKIAHFYRKLKFHCDFCTHYMPTKTFWVR